MLPADNDAWNPAYFPFFRYFSPQDRVHTRDRGKNFADKFSPVVISRYFTAIPTVKRPTVRASTSKPDTMKVHRQIHQATFDRFYCNASLDDSFFLFFFFLLKIDTIFVIYIIDICPVDYFIR